MALAAIWHSGAAHAQEAAKLPEPQYYGTVYWFDSGAAKLTMLDRQKLNSVAKSKAFGYGGVKATLQAQGPKASVRFQSGQKLEFVFQVPPNIDPQTLAEIVTFDAKKDHRELTYMESKGLLGMKGVQGAGDQGDIPFQAAPYTAAAVKISPSEPMKPGEYAVRIQKAPEVFCFGIDPR
jgi:hypothetical protein